MSEPDPAAIVPLPADADPAACCVPVAGEPTVVRAVRALLDDVPAPRIVVVVPVTVEALVCDALAAHRCADVTVLAASRVGDRLSALAAGLDALTGAPHAPSWILVHDVRYPLVPPEVTGRVLAELRAGRRVAVPVVPMTDSVKAIDERGVITATVDRTTLVAAQYPRGFAAATLRESRTDDVAAALAAGVPVSTVDGHPDGLRFAVPGDEALLAAIIASR